MEPRELRWGASETLTVSCALGDFDPVPMREVEARLLSSQDEVLLSAGDSAWPVTATNQRSWSRLREGARAGAACLVTIVRASPSAVVLQLRTFQGAPRAQGPLPIRLDEAAQEVLRRSFGVGGSVAELARRLDEWLILPPRPGDASTERRAVVIASRDARSFRVLGTRATVDVVSTEEGPRVERILRGSNDARGEAQILIAELSFVDASVAGALAASTRVELEAAVRTSGSYLQLWQRYGDLDHQQTERRATSFGRLRYRDATRAGRGWRVTLLDPPPEAIEALGEELDACFDLEADAATEGSPARGRSESNTERTTLKFKALRDGTLELTPMTDGDEPAVPKHGRIALSVRGDLKRIERRKEAQARIERGSGPMGTRLGLILEGQPVPTPGYKHHAPMSAAAREALGGQPTERQIEAVDAALNTPDIALIQGPPGTGKTAVITAIQRRVAELEHADLAVQHRILVTSTQHDAVENVVARTKVFDLPGIKVDRRTRGDAPAIRPSELFSRAHAERIRASVGDIAEVARIRRARELAVALNVRPGTSAQVAASLRALREEVEGLVPAALLDALAACARELTRRRDADDDGWRLRRRAAEGIRGDEVSFCDDGPHMARKALARLADDLTDDERALLCDCADWEAATAPPWLSRVAELRAALLDRLLTPSPVEGLGLDGETRALVLRVIDALSAGLSSRRTQEESVLASFLHDLETDPEGIEQTLRAYTAVLGSTLQHSTGQDMRFARGLSEGFADFDTVIVDEAARAHPLDLLIPMSLGQRRIVLVGDHRQLPHMLEPEVERELVDGLAAGDLSEATERALKDSLFQRLWGIAEELSARDGQPRVVRLDTQFRMRPALGDFVSRTFYEGNGASSMRLSSPRPDAEFLHGIARFIRGGRELAAAWIDVAGAGERRVGTSYMRRVEAVRAAALAKELLDGDASLSVGVISFYGEQVREIRRELERLGVLESDGDETRIVDTYARGRDRSGKEMERLRVSTVDAFQGREFDVVILSLTRSNRLSDADPAARRRKYGHLLLPNRLCVGMSRQRRLLITVGDLGFARRAKALPAIQALVALCEGDHGVIES